MKKLSALYAIVLVLLMLAAPGHAQSDRGKHIAEGYDFVVAVQWDGTVRAAGDNTYGQCDTSQWRNVIAVDAESDHTLALKKDGTVYAAGRNEFGQCDVQDWKDIVMVTADYNASYGLKKDGTVVTTSKKDNRANREIAAWQDIVWIDAIWGDLFAIDKNGTGYGAGLDSIEIKDAMQIDVTHDDVYVLKRDGTVECDINFSLIPTFTSPKKLDLQDVVAIGGSGNVGLTRDGFLVSGRQNGYYGRWSGIAYIQDGYGITADGLVVFEDMTNLSNEAWEEICSWHVMVDPNRARELGVTTPQGDKAQTNHVLLAENGMRIKGQIMEFGEDSKYAVYAGPGSNTLRGGDGRALVSARGPIEVFGVENGWALICYDVSQGKQRFGYIPALALPKAFAGSKRFKPMNLSALAGKAVILKDTYVTDDPFGTKSPLCTLAAGQKDVLFLGALNDNWVYVQTANDQGVSLRGFVPAKAVQRAEGNLPQAAIVAEGTEEIWTNASPEHHYYDTKFDYFIVPDDAKAVVLPHSITDVRRLQDLLYLEQLTDIKVADDHPVFQSIDGILYSKDGTELRFYPPAREGSQLHLREGTTGIGMDSGLNLAVNFMSIVLPSTYTDDVFSMPKVENYLVSEDNPAYTAIDGVLFTKDGTRLVAYPLARRDESYTVPQGTVEIGDYAFDGAEHLKHVALPQGVETIGWGSFGGCTALQSVVFPNTLSVIDEGAFSGCSSLRQVELPTSLGYIGYAAFSSSGLSGELRIPEGVVYLGARNIENISVKDLYLPASLRTWEFDSENFYADLQAGGEWGPVIYAPRGSWAETFARDEGFRVVVLEP